jgi:glycosyltransferase involved in cell wall biosynthesis
VLKNLKLSVAVVTRNRPESLERCLRSWRAQAVQPHEIVVSDDSDEEYASPSREIIERYSCRYVRGPRRGLYANRNNVATACTGTHILTGDDDHDHPQGYVETALELILEDPMRVWIFTERYHEDPDCPLTSPPELHRSGFGKAPKDPFNCAAIADGSTIYPRQIFDSGLRYDETYRFGGIWYLWGKILSKHGWRISFSDRTFIWHNAVVESRYFDTSALEDQLSCATYVAFVDALWINPSLVNALWAMAYLIKRVVIPNTTTWFRVKSKISIGSAWRLVKLVSTYPSRTAHARDAGDGSQFETLQFDK